jgi:hypothetical protein
VVDLPRDAGFEACLRSAHQQGALLVLAHPHWTGNSLEDALRHGFDGVEIYNHVCHWLNGKSGGLVHWDAMLGPDPGALSFAVDDAHLRPEHPGWNGGWIMVNAKERSATEILASIRRGHFYSTCGPEIHSIHIDGDQLCLRTSPIRFARLAGPGAIGRRVGRFDGPLVTEVRIPVSRDWHYVYAEVEDGNGRRAWTNTLFPAVRRG